MADSDEEGSTGWDDPVPDKGAAEQKKGDMTDVNKDAREDNGLLMKIDKFDGKLANWPDFRMDFEAVLGGLDTLLEHLEKPKPTTALSREYKERSARIFRMLVLVTSGEARAILTPFKIEKDGKGAWDYMAKKYEGEGAMAAVELQKRLFAKRLGPRQDPDVYFSEISVIYTQLKQLGNAINEESLATMVVGNLPENYQMVQTILGGEAKLNYDEVQARVRAFYRQQVENRDVKGGSGGGRGEQAHVAGFRRKGPCHKCKQMGHYFYECPEIECKKCGQNGHTGQDCGKKSQTKKTEHAKVCSICDADDHVARKCPLYAKAVQATQMLEGRKTVAALTVEQEDQLKSFKGLVAKVQRP